MMIIENQDVHDSNTDSLTCTPVNLKSRSHSKDALTDIQITETDKENLPQNLNKKLENFPKNFDF